MAFISYLDAQGVHHQDSVHRLDSAEYVAELELQGATNIKISYQ